jgi:hypothetical protein
MQADTSVYFPPLLSGHLRAADAANSYSQGIVADQLDSSNKADLTDNSTVLSLDGHDGSCPHGLLPTVAPLIRCQNCQFNPAPNSEIHAFHTERVHHRIHTASPALKRFNRLRRRASAPLSLINKLQGSGTPSLNRGKLS